MANTKNIILRKIKIANFKFDLEIYSNLEKDGEFAWEIFPMSYTAALYAFSNKNKIEKIVKEKHIYEPKNKG